MILTSGFIIFKIFIITFGYASGNEYDEIMDREDCGLVKLGPGRQGRILNGNAAFHGEYPWQVALYTSLGSITRSVYCGGSLVNDEWVVTAAHCLDAIYSPSSLHVSLGEHDILSSNELHEKVERKAEKMISHPEYIPYGNFHFDVGLVRLNRPVTFDLHIQPICLPFPSSKQLVGKFVHATGWGRYFEDGKAAKILQEVALPVLRNKVCEKMLIKIGEPTPLEDHFICAGYKNGKRDTCTGDSGGPLQYRARDGHWELIGIVSWGYGCGRRNKPGLSTRVTKVRDWIVETIQES